MSDRLKEVKVLLESKFIVERKKRYILHAQEGKLSPVHQPRYFCDIFYEVFD